MDQVLEKPAEHLTYTKSENRNESPKEKKKFFFFLQIRCFYINSHIYFCGIKFNFVIVCLFCG